MRHLIQLLAALCCALTGLQAAAQAEKRVALVIGNAAYRAVAELPNPRKDARDVAAALRAAAFGEVVERYDLGVQQMRELLAAFEDKATGADWAVVYYAGHGIEVDGRNYLVPVDAKLDRASDVEDETLALERVLARVSAAGKLQLVILDACRNNPFKARLARATKRLIGERGLARVEPAHPNVLVAYAARDGETALDGPAGANSPYAKALAKYLAEPGLEVGTFFRKVRDDVMAETGGRQRPFEYGSLTGQLLYFRPGATAAPVPAPAPAAVAQPSRAEVAQICQSVAANPSLAVLEALLDANRGTPMVPCIEARIAELRKLALAAPPAPNPAAPPTVLRPPAPASRPEPAVGVFNPVRAAAPLTAAEERALKPKDSFKECNECPEMVVVPAGSFMMGSPPGEDGREPWNAGSESPQHRVTIARPFAIGRFEVTFDAWDACVAGGGCSQRPGDEGWGRGRRPAINVSWDDITTQYLPWLSGRTGRTYRLPTESEWEYAARSDTTTPFSTGPTISRSQANLSHGAKTVEVGSFGRNTFGLHDMHGNVWEWVQDCWNSNYKGAPSNGTAWTSGDCRHHVVRGGSWSNTERESRSAYRDKDRSGERSKWGGFRVVRMLTP